MAYYNFPTGYQPVYPTQPNAFPTQQSVGNNQPNTQGSLIWVQGEAGAKSYLVAPNQTVQLWDSEAQTIYLKSADASGMPSIKVLDYVVRDTTTKPVAQPSVDYATKEDVASVKAELDKLKSGLIDMFKDKAKESE